MTAVILLSVAVAILCTVIILEIWQIRKIRRQMNFIRDNRSNMKIAFDTSFLEINKLIRSINDVLEKYKKIEIQNEHRENELKSTITNLSHDIRTPLTSLDGYFQLLLQAETEEEKQHYSKIIRERLKTITDILEELFTYTKLQDSNYELVIEPINITQVLCDSVFAFYEDFSQMGIEPNIEIYEGILKINGNEEALKRVFHNIIKNAKEHGSGFVSIKLAQDNGRIVFRCSNSVSNTDNIEVDRVFDRFYKFDKARTTTSTGLGLSIAKELVQRMDGNIEADLKNGIFSVSAGFDIV